MRSLAREQNERIAAAFAEQQGRLRAIVHRQVVDDRDVEEIVQEVFYELVLAYRLMQPIEHLAAWLTRVARHRIIDRFRARTRRFEGTGSAAQGASEPDGVLESLEVPAAEGPEAQYTQGLLADALQAALAELPREQLEVFVAHELEGLTFRQIASRTGIGVNTLLGRKHAAVLHLRTRLRVVLEELEAEL